MECRDITDLFVSYHDGELSPSDQAAFEEHLEKCESCRSEWEEYRSTVDELSGLSRLDLQEDFVSHVQQTIKRRSKGRFFNEEHQYSVKFAVFSFILIVAFVMMYLVLTGDVDIQVLSGD